jgi:branched-chain amino acid transport system substrate-binding protein
MGDINLLTGLRFMKLNQIAGALCKGLTVAGVVGALSMSSVLAQPIQVVRSLALTGVLASYGEAKRDGGDAYIEKINKAGGVNGHKIVLTTVDDGYDPVKTVANLRSLAAEKRPVAFLGLFGVPPVGAALPILEELRIPAVGLTSGTAALRNPLKRYAFPVRTSYADESDFIVAQMKTLGYKRVGIVHLDNPFGILVRDTAVAALKKGGVEMAADVKLSPTATNADAEVEALVAAKSDAIFFATTSNGAGPVMQAVKARRLAGVGLYALSPVDATAMTGKIGKGAAGLIISQIVPPPDSLNSRIAREYVEAVKELGRSQPSFYGLEGFIEAKILVTALNRIGKNTIDPESLVQALESLGDFDLGDYPMSYSKTSRKGGSFIELTIIGSRGALIK